MRQTIFILGLIFISLSFCGCKDDNDTPSFGYLSPFSGVYSPAFESRLLHLTVNSEEKSDATVSFSSSDMTTASITLNNVIEGYEKFEIREVILKKAADNEQAYSMTGNYGNVAYDGTIKETSESTYLLDLNIIY